MAYSGSLDTITEIGHAIKRMKKKIEASEKKIDVLDDHVRMLEIELSRAEHEIRILKA